MAISQKQNAVVTLSIGEQYKRLSQITHPTIQAYATKINADFVIIDRPNLERDGFYHFEKFQIYELLNNYERILFVDTDVVISPRSPDIFTIVPPLSFGAFVVSIYNDYHDYAIKIIQEKLGQIGWKREYFNSGVMVISRQHREIFNTETELFQQWYDYSNQLGIKIFPDQTIINYLVQKLAIPLYDIGYQFNHTTAPQNSSDRFNSYIIHYPGKGHRRGKKIAQIQKDLFIINNPMLWKFSARFPTLNRVLDLLV